MASAFLFVLARSGAAVLASHSPLRWSQETPAHFGMPSRTHDVACTSICCIFQHCVFHESVHVFMGDAPAPPPMPPLPQPSTSPPMQPPSTPPPPCWLHFSPRCIFQHCVFHESVHVLMGDAPAPPTTTALPQHSASLCHCLAVITTDQARDVEHRQRSQYHRTDSVHTCMHACNIHVLGHGGMGGQGRDGACHHAVSTKTN